MSKLKFGRHTAMVFAVGILALFTVALLALNIQYTAGLNPGEADFAQAIGKFHMLQGIGIVMALMLLVFIIMHVMRNLRSEEDAVQAAQAQTEQILSTVSEGLFLLDKEMNIGSEHSAALTELFRRDEFEGLSFRNLLANIVPEKTMDVALDFIELLWGDRVNENLVKDLNPLNEVEVNFSDEQGGFETRHLAFDFNRVKIDNQLSHILVTVVDITERVELARELETSQAEQQAQLDLMLSILHVEPAALNEFLADTDRAMEEINDVLKRPAREESAFREKLDGIFRLVHTIKGESAVLGLPTIEVKAHAFEDVLQEMREQSSLDGNAFLPLAVKLDDLLSHMASVHDLIARLGDLRDAVDDAPSRSNAGGDASDVESARAVAQSVDMPDGVAESDASKSLSALEPSLALLASRVASETGKEVELHSAGFELIPDEHRKLVRDVVVQFVRNAVYHGLEDSEDRQAAGKSAVGRVDVVCATTEDGGFKLTVKDDGRGLDAETIRIAAIRKGMLSAEAAVNLEDRKVVAMIFKPGFSTAEEVGAHAGRGVGMDIVKSKVEAAGGRIRISTRPGVMTAFGIQLPAKTSIAA